MTQTQATMTEQEAQALAARLTRIWEPTKPVAVTPWTSDDKYEEATWLIQADLRSGLQLDVYTSEWGNAPSIRLGRWGGEASCGTLLSHFEDEDEDGQVSVQAKEGEPWLPFFRRGCWLSGCPIEATAHEKAEWLQGFSREEIDAWNLKM